MTKTKTRPTPGWWITTGRLEQGGETHMGPFADRDLAHTVRYYVEKVEGRSDLWIQEVGEDGVPRW